MADRAVPLARRGLHAVPAAATGSGWSTGCPRRRARRRSGARSSTPSWSGSSTCPRGERTLDAARGLLARSGTGCRRRSPSSPRCSTATARPLTTWLAGAEELLARWFELEDPTRLEPAERELYVETVLDDGLVLRGYVDRLDVAPDGRVRVVDYKTGRAPGEIFEAKALFQMKFYALVLWRLRGAVPAMLQLVYLGSGEILRYAPDEADLLATERKVKALWAAIARAARDRRLAGVAEQAVRLVRPPAAVPGLGRHSPAAAGRRRSSSCSASARRHWPRPGLDEE